MNSKVISILSILRNILGAFLIFLGFVMTFSVGVAAGIFVMLSGLTILPIFYKKTKINKKFKYITIILPIALIVVAIFMPQKNNTDTLIKTEVTNSSEENKKIKLSALNFKDSEIETDIKENKEIILEVSPSEAEKGTLEFFTSNDKIAILENKNISDENSITLNLKPIGEGDCEVYVKSSEGVESNKITVKVIDNERVQAEEQAKKEAEEQAKKEDEEQSKIKAAEEQSQMENKQKNPTSTNNSKNVDNSSTSQKKSTTQKSNANNSHGSAIYRTPHGKKYHYDPDCGGKNSYKITLSQAKSSGLTPCKKCVH